MQHPTSSLIAVIAAALTLSQPGAAAAAPAPNYDAPVRPGAARAAFAPPKPELLTPERCQNLGAYAFSRARASRAKDRLAQIPDAPTSILSATVVAAERDVPEVCKVNGIVAPNINFELRMPTRTWNGKFMHYGCGGACGVIYRQQLEEPLARGYAVVSSDMGHTGSPNNWAFLYGNLQGILDFSYRATHVVTLASKEIVDEYYGTYPKYSYHLGCSTGGAQGVIEAQRYPYDFDGIIVGAPAYGTGPSYSAWAISANIGADGRGILDPDKLPMIRKAVLASCDTLDGYEDGLLQDPRQCKWDPAAIQCPGKTDAQTCLTPAEVGVVRKIYAGPSNSSGESLGFGDTGMLRGSEYEWAPSFIGPKGQPAKDAGKSASDYGDNIYPPAAANAGHDYDYDVDPYRGNTLHLGAILGWARYGMNPDLRRFKQSGAKMILWHGWDDNEVAPGASADYYETTTRTMGGEAATKDFFRLFLLPGVGHCRRGPGGDAVDFISYLENWVEKGQAPDQVIAHHLVKEQPYLGLPRPRYPLPAEQFDRTRPVYAYPDTATYSGSGDPKSADSWVKRPRGVAQASGGQ